MVLSKVANESAAQCEEDDAPKTFVNQLLGISKSGGNLTDNEIMSEMLTMVLAVKNLTDF
jgi:cytochrome P450